MVSLPKDVWGNVVRYNGETDEFVQYVHERTIGYDLTPSQLGKIFERYVGVSIDDEHPERAFSRTVNMSELVLIHPDFKTANGCQWARDDVSWLGKRYVISRTVKGRSVNSVRLDGPNKNSLKSNRSISDAVKKAFTGRTCTILDVIPSSGIEIDHKNGRYDEHSNMNVTTQNVSDFQPLSKSANDAKRQHCKECRDSGIRYDATRLGYSVTFIAGDANS